MVQLPPGLVSALERAEQMVVEESGSAMLRSISLAEGDCCDVRPDGKRIYYRAPDLTSIEYMVNRVLGTPGAKAVAELRATGDDIEDLLADINHELEHLPVGADPLDPEGPLRAILGKHAAQKADYKAREADLMRRAIEFLPTAITRLTELCAGVTVRREYYGRTRTYTLRPNRRAIEYLCRRLHGASRSIMEEANGRGAEAPDAAREYTPEEIAKLTTTQVIALLKASEALDHKSADAPEGELEEPEYSTAATSQMAEFLPHAVSHLQILARGAKTVIETDSGDVEEISHPPDARANQYFVDRFMGEPANRFVVTRSGSIDTAANADSIERYMESIIKHCTAHPDHTGKEEYVRDLLRQLTEPG